jgi:hypothetical protein
MVGRRFGALALAMLLLAGGLTSTAIVPAVAIVPDPGGSPNGHQDLVFDPVRPQFFMNRHLPEYPDSLYIYLEHTAYFVNINAEIQSMDIGANGSLMYIADSKENCVKIFNLDSLEVVNSIPLGFKPLSVKAGEAGRLFISELDGTLVKIIDTGTGNMTSSFDPGYRCILELSPDKHTLLTISVQTNPVKVCKYSISNGSASLAASDDNDLGHGFQQDAVDWLNGKVYLASSTPLGVEVVSLSTLDRLGILSMDVPPTGVALSQEGSTVYTVGMAPGASSSTIYAFDTTNGRQIGTKLIYMESDYFALDWENKAVLVGPPRYIQFAAISPTLYPWGFPGPGQVLDHSPEYVEISLEQGLPAIDVDNISVRLNDISLPHSDLIRNISAPDALDFDIGFELPDGKYEVVVSTLWNGNLMQVNWSFFVEQNSSAIGPPYLLPYEPGPNASLVEAPTIIKVDAGVQLAELNYSAGIWLDEIALTVQASPAEPTRLMANIDVIGPGQHNITATIISDRGNDSVHWSFSYMESITLTPLSPLPGSILTSGPVHVEVQLSQVPAWVAISEMRIRIDGTLFSAELSVANVMSASIPTSYWEQRSASGELNGQHEVTASASTTLGPVAASWEFTIATPLPPPPTIVFTPLSYKGIYNLPLAEGWEAARDVKAGEQILDLTISGPVSNGFTSNVIVQHGYDISVRNNPDYLYETAIKIVDQMQGQGYAVEVLNAPANITVSNHSAMVFTIIWHSQPELVQKAAIIVSQEHQMYWIITCTATVGQCSDVGPIFDHMISGFNITSEVSIAERIVGDMVIYGIIGAAVAVAVLVGIFFFVSRRKRSNNGGRYPPVN